MNGGPRYRVSSASLTATPRGSTVRRSRSRSARREPTAPRPVGVRPPHIPRPEGQDHRLAGAITTTTPPRHQIRELVAINAKFFTNESKRTLVLASSVGEKRGVNQTSARGPLSTYMHRG